jgi:hypothetical protein
MAITLHPTLAAYLQANNERNTAAQLACFSPDAVVIDEEKTHRGPAEIGRWLSETSAAYAAVFEATDVSEQGSETVVTCLVGGNFPGSPVHLRFFFTLADDRLVGLKIHP